MARFAWAHSGVLSHLFIPRFQKSPWQLKSPCLHTGFCKVYAWGFCLARCNSLIISAAFPILSIVVVSVTTSCVSLPGKREETHETREMIPPECMSLVVFLTGVEKACMTLGQLCHRETHTAWVRTLIKLHSLSFLKNIQVTAELDGESLISSSCYWLHSPRVGS